MTPQKMSALVMASLETLKAHGLPSVCLTGPVPWQGTAEQQASLDNLHRALNDCLPPLPGQEIEEIPHSPDAGPTGRFPYGQMNADDEGELAVAVAADRETETVYVDFGKPIRSFGMRPEHAEGLAETLRNQAQKAKR